MTSINDRLRHCTGTEKWHRYNFGTVITDGVKELAETGHCFWYLDIIASYQPQLKKKNINYQYWKLEKGKDDSATVTCYSQANVQNDNYILIRQYVTFTDFEYDQAVVWVKDNVMLLPTED